MAKGRDRDGPLTPDETVVLFAPLASVRHVLVAVSGGADSVALLHALSRWAEDGGRPVLSAATVDHGLRPEAGAEAVHVAMLAARYGLPHRVLAADHPLPESGIEQAARELRYGLLEEHAAAIGADCLVTAHTLDDQAETVLMRLAAGSGPAGLAGMKADLVRPGGLRHVRPFLEVAKARLQATLRAAGIAWCEDAMNRDTRFARARLRISADILRREGLTPTRLAQLARRMARADLALEQAADAVWNAHASATEKGLVIDAGAFLSLPDELRLRLLRRAIESVAAPPSLRVERLEVLADAVSGALASGTGMARTLGGARVACANRRLIVSVAPPRRSATRLNG